MLGRQEGNEFNNTSYYNRITSNFLHIKTPSRRASRIAPLLEALNLLLVPLSPA
jgi:hypothetical protein